jgi:hypothetical protein
MRTLFEHRPSRRDRLWALARRHPLRLATTLLAAATAVLLVFAWQAISNWRRYDPAFDARIANPAFRDAPLVLVDAGHYDVHTASTSYRPFARLLEADGCQVEELGGRVTETALSRARVLIIPNALGAKGALAMLANAVRLRSALDWSIDAFDSGEVATITRWVDAGGGLLIVSDHKPAGAAVARLGRAFGVSFNNWYTEDAAAGNHDRVSDAWTFLVFSRANGLLADHPITNGRDATERVESVISFTGGSLRGPSAATAILKLSATARDFPTQNSPDSAGRPVAGAAQALALSSGRGRVVILGEAGMLGAYTLHRGGQEYPFGMNRRDHGNRQLAVNLVRWLARVI